LFFADFIQSFAVDAKRRGRARLEALHAEGWIGAGSDVPLVLGGQQIRVDPSTPGGEVLNRFYRMWRFTYVKAFMGAYHQSPSVSDLENLEALQRDVEFIRNEADRLRGEGTSG